MLKDAILRTSSSVKWIGCAAVNNNSKTLGIWLHHFKFLSQIQTVWDSYIYIIFSYISLAEGEIKIVSDVVEEMEVSVPPKGKVHISVV